MRHIQTEYLSQQVEVPISLHVFLVFPSPFKTRDVQPERVPYLLINPCNFHSNEVRVQNLDSLKRTTWFLILSYINTHRVSILQKCKKNTYFLFQTLKRHLHTGMDCKCAIIKMQSKLTVHSVYIVSLISLLTIRRASSLRLYKQN